MDFPTVFFIALGLSMDAFAVSITSGITIKNCQIKHAVLLASFFGGFQAVMPVAGWLAGSTLKSYIIHIDHWIAFGLLGFIGGKMIYESTILDKTENRCNPLDMRVLVGLSIATSIDALAVGVTFAFLDVLILTPVIVIGVVTFLLSYIGVFIGEKMGSFFEKKIEIAGGAVLILIGLKILAEHLLRHS